jgi:hypothetical protein
MYCDKNQKIEDRRAKRPLTAGLVKMGSAVGIILTAGRLDNWYL